MNTGVDASFAALPLGFADAHYVSAPCGSSQSACAALPPSAFSPASTYSVGDYSVTLPSSRWIGGSSVGGGSWWAYSTTFTVADPFRASIAGQVLCDDSCAVYLNGVPTGASSGGWGSASPVSITSGFAAGANTLSFVVYNTILYNDISSPSGVNAALTLMEAA